MIKIVAPPSKSVSHRAVLAASLACGESLLTNVLGSRDLERTIAILSAAGVSIVEVKTGVFRVKGACGALVGGVSNAPLACDVHESGTTCRLLTAVLATGKGHFRVYGAGRMHERPIGELVDVLVSMGVNVTYEGRAGCAPLLIETNGLEGGRTSITLDDSSQYLSGLLFAAPLASHGMVINIAGSRAVSWPYVGLTLQMLDNFGIDFGVQQIDGEAWISKDWRTITEIKPGEIRFVIAPGRYVAKDVQVEGDWSGASYFLAAGAVGKKPVRVSGLLPNSLQGDRAILDILGKMGAKIKVDGQNIEVYPSSLHGIDVDMGSCPDLVPTVAAVAAFAEGVTKISGVSHLRIKESDRISAPITEMRKVGVEMQEFEDGLSITGGINKPEGEIMFSSHQDHRIAMSLAVLGLAGFEVKLDDSDVVQKSFPNFWELWRKIR